AALLLAAARLGLLARLRRGEGAADQRGELLARVLEVARLVARRLARDHQAAVGVEAALRDAAQARLGVGADRARALEVEAQVHLRRHLVDVLTAGAARARGGPGEVGRGDGHPRADPQRVDVTS